MTAIKIPELCLVVLVGVSGSGKSTFAAKHFLPTEVISSDFCRGLVSDDENDQTATNAAFDVLHFIAGKRLEAGASPSSTPRTYSPSPDALSSAWPKSTTYWPSPSSSTCPNGSAPTASSRPERQFGAACAAQPAVPARRSCGGLRREGFHRVYVLSGEEEIEAATFEREPLWNDRRTDTARSTSSATSTAATPSWSNC